MKESTSQRITPIQISFLTLPIFVFILAVSCSDSTGPDTDKLDDRLISSQIGPDGGTLEVTATDGTACRLTIPAGTLSEAANIKITAESSPNESIFTPLANSFLLEPEGLEFDEPITIEITAASEISSDKIPAILHTSADRPGMLLETQVDGQTLSTSLTHFSSVTPVVPSAAELELYWDSVMLEISTYGLNEWRAMSLYFMYMIAYSGRNGMYSSIDLTTWEAVLRVQTSGLIAIGSQLCSSGNHTDAESKLNMAINIAKNMPFTDLEAVAQQALDDCRQASDPNIYARASSVDDQARIYINGAIAVETAWGLGPGGVSVGHQSGDSGWVDVTDKINDGNNTFRFWVWNKAVCCGTGGTFEIKVRGEIVISREFHEQDSTEGVKYDETVTFDFSSYIP